jgi:hypothetical protein
MDMKAANRSVSWTEACSRVENGQGCLISDHLSMKGPVRLWWTSDDVAVITPYACFFEEFPDSLEPLNSEFDMWCRSRYTNAELGTALLVELSSTTTRVAPVSRRKAFSWSSAQICELERHQQADRFAAVAQRHHKQPRAAIPASGRITDHGAGAVIHLAFFTWGGFDYGARFRRVAEAA